MTNETIEDIVAEMRLHTRCSAADAFYDIVAWTKLCDRIEAAAKRENDSLRYALSEIHASIKEDPYVTIQQIDEMILDEIYKKGANND